MREWCLPDVVLFHTGVREIAGSAAMAIMTEFARKTTKMEDFEVMIHTDA